MPAKSKAQRIVMAIAEHHPDQLYARNRGVLSMNQQQLHDFAATPAKKLPEHTKAMHPVMHERAQMVKEAHSHLAQAIPNFHKLPARQRMMAAQHHVELRMGKAK